MRCIAVPVHGAPTLAAISVSGPDSRLTKDSVHHILPAILSTATRLSLSTHPTLNPRACPTFRTRVSYVQSTRIQHSRTLGRSVPER